MEFNGLQRQKLSKYLAQIFTSHGNEMICQPVTLSGYTEWPKVADAVIEAHWSTTKSGGMWKKLKDASDWDRAAGMTDKEIEAADAQDPEVADIDDAWMDKAEVVRSPKRTVYAVFDAYVIDYFKNSGRGYQGRMNAVLKAYVDAQLQKRTP